MKMLRIVAGTGISLVWIAGCGSTGSSNASRGDAGAAADGTTGVSGGTGAGGDDAGSGTGSSGGGGGSSSSGGGGGGSGGGMGGGSGGGPGSSGGASGADGGGSVGASVPQFHNHVNRDGFFIDPALTKAAAATVHRDKTFAGTVTGNMYASPLYVEHGPGGKGALYVVTESNNVYALDESTGTPIWTHNVGTPAARSGAGCGNINPIGITGTPAIDLATRLIVFSATTANASGDIATETIHALSIDDGSEKWSVDVSKLTDPSGTTFSPQAQNQRGAVLIVGGEAYVVFGGHYGDCGSYHGWVIGVPVATGTGAKAWATQTPGAGIWGPGGPSSDGTSIYVTTGNGIGGPQSWAESEGVFRLDPGPTFRGMTADSFAPSNWQMLDQNDTDLGGSGPLVIDAPEMKPSALIMAEGKDGNAYLLDRTNLGGAGSTPLGQLNVLNGTIINAAAWAHVPSGTYVVMRPNEGGSGAQCPNGTSGDLVAVKLDPSAPQKMTVAWCADAQGEGSPIITTSDGASDALVWSVGAESSNVLLAWDLATGQVVFSGGAMSDQIPGVRRFTSPIVAHGRVFAGADGVLYAMKP